ncbi:MAG TPA: N-acetylglucosamine-specific PTS transporter subunit IIBC [Steroidobacteraceae bacterium]|nr:N-acetylglucosamine-specific PTS transporter subunit IIBC [Steroidobacteraceae bacterium]
MKRLLASLQKVGGALMLPIAVLPIAGLLLRLGQPDLLDSAYVAAAGEAIFSNLGLLFAIGVAVGLARENHGAAGLASVVAYLVATKGAEVLIGVPPEAVADVTGRGRELAIAAYKAHELAKLSVPVGILSGLTGGLLYNRFYKINLPSYLSFFGGRRFVPIVSGLAGLLLAVVFGTQWQHLEQGMDALSRWVLHAGSFGLFAYGVLNRILIVTGLHHIINNIAWFLLGDYHGVTGDLKRFFAGDPSAGVFMSGFFPVMMFGLPAACLAMYHTALPERRRLVGGLLGSIALTSILTGVTEPIEFTFMFLAPALYAVHALLTGVAFIIMNALHVRLGFGFSAGLFDYLLNFNRATRPLWLLPVGAVYFALYYVLFRFVIVRFDLKTPGRDRGETPAATPAVAPATRARAWVAALGGATNLRSVDACTTRLRLLVASQSAVDTEALKQLGARGLVRPSAEALQVVVGTIADQIAGEIREALRGASTASEAGPRRSEAAAPLQVPAAAARADNAERTDETWSGDARALLSALGGHDNVRAVDTAASRLRISVGDAGLVDRTALAGFGLRGVAVPLPGCVHLIVGPAAGAAGAALRRMLTDS